MLPLQCFTDGSKPETRYPVMRDALNATGRPIFFSMCEWGVDLPAGWVREVGNSWRTTIDIEDTWLSVLFNLELSAPLWKYAGPGGFNDPDMLEIGVRAPEMAIVGACADASAISVLSP